MSCRKFEAAPISAVVRDGRSERPRTRRWAQLPFERPPTGVRNPNTSYPDVSVTHSHGLPVPRSEPAPNEIGKHYNSEPVIEQSCSSAASLACRGKQFECTTLVRVE
jgi:hypothetical protein